MRRKMGLKATLLAVVSFAVLLGSCGNKGKTVPEPDERVIYYDGRQTELTKGDSGFSELYELIKVNLQEGVLETLVEDETINNAKEDLAVEYIYQDEQELEIGDDKESISGMFFFLSEWCEGEAAFGKNGEYQSGTVEFSCDKEKVKDIATVYEDD